MLSSWKRCRCTRRRTNLINTTTNSQLSTTTSPPPPQDSLSIPNHFLCPISLDLMKDPVTLPTGITYDRQNIETWIIDQGHATCPVTNQPLNLNTIIEPTVPNHAIRRMIQDWCVANRNHGVERISTPRPPLTSSEAADLLARVNNCNTTSSSSSNSSFNHRNVTGLVLRRLRESERDRRLIISRGGPRILAATFESLAAAIHDDQDDGVAVSVLDEILACLVLMGRLDHQAQLHLGTPASLKRIVWFMGKGDDLSTRRNAVLILKQITTTTNSSSLAAVAGVEEALVKLVKDPICPLSLKAALVVLHRLLNSPSLSSDGDGDGDYSINKLVDLNMATELLEIAIGTSNNSSNSKSLCEKALGVIHKLCDGRKGRESLRRNALTVPLLVKKMLRVSTLATEFAVSALWKLAVTEDEGRGRLVVLDQAIQVGAFQKLLLVLQVGLGGTGGGSSHDDEEGGGAAGATAVTTTKVKVTQLLKMLNGVLRTSGKSRFHYCVESWDLKGVN